MFGSDTHKESKNKCVTRKNLWRTCSTVWFLSHILQPSHSLTLTLPHSSTHTLILSRFLIQAKRKTCAVVKSKTNIAFSLELQRSSFRQAFVASTPLRGEREGRKEGRRRKGGGRRGQREAQGGVIKGGLSYLSSSSTRADVREI